MGAVVTLETTYLAAENAWLFVAWSGDSPNQPRHTSKVDARELDRLILGSTGRPIPNEEGIALLKRIAFDLCMTPETLAALWEAQRRPRMKPKVQIVLDAEPTEKRWEREAQAEVDAICTALKDSP